MPQTLLDTSQTSALLKVTVPTLLTWVTEGKIAFVRIGRKYWFTQETIDALLEPHIHEQKQP